MRDEELSAVVRQAVVNKTSGAARARADSSALASTGQRSDGCSGARAAGDNLGRFSTRAMVALMSTTIFPIRGCFRSGWRRWSIGGFRLWLRRAHHNRTGDQRNVWLGGRIRRRPVIRLLVARRAATQLRVIRLSVGR